MDSDEPVRKLPPRTSSAGMTALGLHRRRCWRASAGCWRRVSPLHTRRDQVDACAAALKPLHGLIEAHVLTAARLWR
jgi:hypothetical protein